MVALRSASDSEEALFKQVKPEFTRRIMAEGCQVQIRAVEKDEDDYAFYVVAQGIAYTVKFSAEEGEEIVSFTVEKTKKKSSCTIL